VLYLPRQHLGAERQHRRGAVEDLHHRGAKAAWQEQGRSAAMGTGRCRHLVVANDRCEARHGLHRHRQQLLRPVAEDQRRRDRAGHEERHDQVGQSNDAQRQLDARLPTGESGQSELPGEDGTRSRLLCVAESRHGERTRSAHPPAEVRRGLRARSRQGRRSRVAVPHRSGQRTGRTVGRRR
jgi:hypothetical protein